MLSPLQGWFVQQKSSQYLGRMRQQHYPNLQVRNRRETSTARASSTWDDQSEVALGPNSTASGIVQLVLHLLSRAKRQPTPLCMCILCLVCGLAVLDIWHIDNTTVFVLAILNEAENLWHS